MKIYFIDKEKKNLCIKNAVEENGIELEYKENIKFRINKTDIVITTDFDNDYEDYKKVQKLIIITRCKR